MARRCPYGYPQVVVTHPLHRTEEGFVVFPTLFWLTCPFLGAEVARLESAGAVKRYEARLQADSGLAARYLAAHDAYRRERWALLSPRTGSSSGGPAPSIASRRGSPGSGTPPGEVPPRPARPVPRPGENPIGEAVAGSSPALLPARADPLRGAETRGAAQRRPLERPWRFVPYGSAFTCGGLLTLRTLITRESSATAPHGSTTRRVTVTRM